MPDPKQPATKKAATKKAAKGRTYIARASQGIIKRGSGVRHRGGVQFGAHDVTVADHARDGAVVVTPAQLDEILADPEIICREPKPS